MILLVEPSNHCSAQSVVEKFGHLNAKGKYLTGNRGDTVQLKGMSLFWSQWMGSFYNASLVKWLRDDWKISVVRAAMGVQSGGYETNGYEEKEKVKRVVKAALDLGIYVIVDYHSHEAHTNPKLAIKFFTEIAKGYGHYPNIIYEIYNEPLQDASWIDLIKPYSIQVIQAIRKYDPDNLIIVGTRQWSQLVDEATTNPVADVNVAYALHFYAGTHKQWLRDEALNAMSKDKLLFVTEFGTCNASGNDGYDAVETQAWWDFLDTHKISWCNWSVSDKDETASIIPPGSNYFGKWKETDLTPSGKLVREELRRSHAELLKK